MGIYDNQFKERKKNDDQAFEDALLNIESSVTGQKRRRSTDRGEALSGAVSEVLNYFDIKEKDSDFDYAETLDAQLEQRVLVNGIFYREVSLKPGWEKNAMGPMLGFLEEDGGCVALMPGKFSGYEMVDKSDDTRVRVGRKTRELLSEKAIYFYRPLPNESLKIKDLLIYVKNLLSKADIAIAVVSIVAVMLMDLLIPVLSQKLFSEVLESDSLTLFAAVGIFFLCTTISGFLVSLVNSLINDRISDKVDLEVSSAVMMRILSMPTEFFSNYSTGELSQKIQYVNELCGTFISVLLNEVLGAILALAFIIQIAVLVPAMIWPAVIFVILMLIYMLLVIKVRKNEIRNQAEAEAASYATSYSLITGIQTIKLAGAEKRAFAKWGEKFSAEAKLSYNPSLFSKVSEVISLIISLAASVAFFYVAVKGGVNVAGFYAFEAAFGMLSGGIMGIVGASESFALIDSMSEVVRPFLVAVPESSDAKQAVVNLSGRIGLDHLSFKYTDDSPLVIDDLTLNIKPGEYVAIVGTTGCGKSTLLRLLLGFETPQKGSVYFDGNPISTLDKRTLRKNIGTVLQKGRLIQESIYENIVLSHPELTMDDAWKAAEIAGIDEEIREMPMGMHTLISEGSGGISGGQRQRILIARAVAAKPKILLFDEATSALDNITQKKVSEAIDKLGCTRVVIAHRLSTIRHCDRIIVLDKGKVAEQGTYEKLIEKDGLFRELVKRQLTQE